MKYKRMTKSGGLKQSSVYSLNTATYVNGYEIVETQNDGLVQQLIERLAELEDDIESGKIIRLPCKVGDTVYAIYKFTDYNSENKNSSHYEIFESEMSGFFIDKKMIFSEFNKPLVGKGKYVCAVYTREEAEARLKELQE